MIRKRTKKRINFRFSRKLYIIKAVMMIAVTALLAWWVAGESNGDGGQRR